MTLNHDKPCDDVEETVKLDKETIEALKKFKPRLMIIMAELAELFTDDPKEAIVEFEQEFDDQLSEAELPGDLMDDLNIDCDEYDGDG